ncbi:MAG: ABC transporter substrate-binding protein [Oscillospiraceae bacterium]|nr:ABC transporter substrate-binding protein [Oscillospiraceae bacterium]
MKKIVALLLALMMILSLVACGAKEEVVEETEEVVEEVVEETTEETEDVPYVAMVSLGYSHQFWQAVKQGAEEAAAEYGVTITFEGPEQETMVDEQVDMLNTAIQNGPEAICMAAIDVASVTTILEEQKANGIPLVGFDAGLGDTLPAVNVASNNAEAGKLAAVNAAELLGDAGKVAVLGHTETVPDGVARVDGFVDEMKANHPNIEIVDIQYAEGDHMKSAEALKGMLLADPEIDLVYCTNEGACVGAYNGMKELGIVGEVMLVGFDSSKALKDGIRSGDIAGAITQNPVAMGYKTVEAAVKLMNGEDLGTNFIDSGFAWYNAENMDSPEIAPCLYD